MVGVGIAGVRVATGVVGAGSSEGIAESVPATMVAILFVSRGMSVGELVAHPVSVSNKIKIITSNVFCIIFFSQSLMIVG
jgi:hypothetical protein